MTPVSSEDFPFHAPRTARQALADLALSLLFIAAAVALTGYLAAP